MLVVIEILQGETLSILSGFLQIGMIDFGKSQGDRATGAHRVARNRKGQNYWKQSALDVL
jgi:hypothetical protein